MRKADIVWRLKQGQSLVQFLTLRWGQECPIYKTDEFKPGDEVIYIPDLYVHDLKFTEPPGNEEELNDLLALCFTGDDFIDECRGDVEKAERLFWYVDWQTPNSAVDELDDDEPDETEKMGI